MCNDQLLKAITNPAPTHYQRRQLKGGSKRTYLVFQLTTMCPFFFSQPCIFGGTWINLSFSAAILAA